MRADSLLTGAVDIGGTKVSAGLVDGKGKVLAKSSFSTPVAEGARFCADAIAETLKKQLAEKSLEFADLQGIGIGCAGPVDVEKGTVENPYTLPGWDGYPFNARLADNTGLRTAIENDVNAALLGEVLLKDLKNRDVLMLAFGTGIGVAAYRNGELYTGRNSTHPEMGHMLIYPGGPLCYCGNRGCLESLWSGTALNKRAAEEGYGDFDSLFNAFQAGELKAAAFMHNALYELKAGLWNLMTVFKPEIVILGGGIMKHYFSFVEKAMKELMPESRDFIDNYELLPADTQNDSALVGAAELIFREV